MTHIGPFHAKRQDSPDKYYHLYLDCTEAQKIKWSERENGDGGRPLCPVCLSKEHINGEGNELSDSNR